MHLPEHQKLLCEATGESLQKAIEKIRAENPEAFLIGSNGQKAVEALSQRNFFHEPATALPFATCVKDCPSALKHG